MQVFERVLENGPLGFENPLEVMETINQPNDALSTPNEWLVTEDLLRDESNRGMYGVMKAIIATPGPTEGAEKAFGQLFLSKGMAKLAVRFGVGDDSLPPPPPNVLLNSGDSPLSESKTTATRAKEAFGEAIAKKRRSGYITKLDFLDLARMEWRDIQLAKQQPGKNRLAKQQEIAFAPYKSIAESLLGHPKAGLKIGIRAVGRAFTAGLSRTDAHNQRVSVAKRFSNTTDALKDGLTAVSVGVLAQQRIPRLRNKAWSLAARFQKSSEI